MKRNNRLKKNWEFQEIINSKKQNVSSFLIFYFKDNPNKTRIGISVSKKFANAVMRNKYRRQTKAALDVIQPWNCNKDIVIILRKNFLELPFDKKVKELRKMFERF